MTQKALEEFNRNRFLMKVFFEVNWVNIFKWKAIISIIYEMMENLKNQRNRQELASRNNLVASGVLKFRLKARRIMKSDVKGRMMHK